MMRAFLLVQAAKPRIEFGTEGEILSTTTPGADKPTEYRVRFGTEIITVFGGDLLLVEDHDRSVYRLVPGQQPDAPMLTYALINTNEERQVPLAAVLGKDKALSCRHHFIRIVGKKLEVLG